MSPKEQLLLEVQRLSESQAAAVLEFLENQIAVDASPELCPPRFTATGRSGRPDLGAMSEHILLADFGTS